MSDIYYLCDADNAQLFELGKGQHVWPIAFPYDDIINQARCVYKLRTLLAETIDWRKDSEYIDELSNYILNWLCYRNVKLITNTSEIGNNILKNIWCYNNKIEDFDIIIGLYEITGSRFDLDKK